MLGLIAVIVHAGCGDNQWGESMPDATATPSAYAHRTYLKASNTREGTGFGAGVALSHDGSIAAISAQREDSIATGIDGHETNQLAESSGAVYLFERADTGWLQRAYIKASNTDADDRFGVGLALSSDGSVLVVGAEGEDSNATGVDGDQSNNSAPDSGAAYVFVRTATGWIQQAYLKAPGTSPGVGFGARVAVSENGATIAVAALGSAYYEGPVHVFERDGDTWVQRTTLKPANTERGDLSGWALALSADGSTVVTTAIAEASKHGGVNSDGMDNSLPFAGAAYVFAKSDGTWLQQAYIKSPNPEASEFFGTSTAVSSDGSVLVVGASGNSSSSSGIGTMQADGKSPGSGAVYLYRRTEAGWQYEESFKASNPNRYDVFGLAVAVSPEGNTLALAAPGEAGAYPGMDGIQTSNALLGAGAVYIFERIDSTWEQRTYAKASNAGAGYRFGDGIALSRGGDTVLVGSPSEASDATGVDHDQRDTSAPGSGAAYILMRITP
ncbi:MAG: FG-GAP repeat protein [Kofleriaceae bacterium]